MELYRTSKVPYDNIEKWFRIRCKAQSLFRFHTVLFFFSVHQIVHQHNSYAHSFEPIPRRVLSDEYGVVTRADKKAAWEHARCFTKSLTNEVAIVIAGNEFDRRDIVLEKKNNQLQDIAETNRSYDAL